MQVVPSLNPIIGPDLEGLDCKRKFMVFVKFGLHKVL